MNNPTERYKGDVVLYCGPILREGYDKVSTIFEQKDKKDKTLCLILVTHGGDPDAAYRIARAANHHYERIEILIPDVCKSAGTLLCIGAHQLIFGDRGELGPLDIQLSKPDEMFDSMSGLDIIQALNALENQVLTSFRNYLVDIRGGSQIRTKTAADISAKLTDAFISPIAAKIDPLTLGEHQRAMRIAYDYGDRLHAMVESLKDDALINLVSGYSSHGFVIDRREAADLFKNVTAPDDSTRGLYDWARETVCSLSSTRTPIVVDVNEIFNIAEASQSREESNDAPATSDTKSSENVQGSNEGSKSKGKGDERPSGSSVKGRGSSKRSKKKASKKAKSKR